MDIQKEREAFLHEFEKTDQYRQQYSFYKIPLRYDEQKEIWNFYDVQAAWEMWQAAKAQAVPEGFVLVSAEQMSQWGHMANCAEEYGCPECYESRGYAHSLACEINAYFNVSEAKEQK